MFKYRIWNKIDNVGKVTAEYIINKYNITENDNLIIISDNSDIDIEISDVKIIKKNYDLPHDLTSDEVGEKYINILNKLNGNTEPTEVEKMQDKISTLNEQSSKLLLEKAKNEIQINTLNKNLANVTLEVAKMKGGM